LNAELALAITQEAAGNIDCIKVAGTWVFVASSVVVPGRTAVPVGIIQAWDLSSGAVAGPALLLAPGFDFSHKSPITCMDAAVFEDGATQPLLFSGSADGNIRMWQYNAAAGSFGSDVMEGHVRGVTALVWVAGVQRLYSGSVDRTLKVWQVATKACSATILPPVAGAAGAAGGAGGSVFAAAAAGMGAAAAAGGAGGGNGHVEEVHCLSELVVDGNTFLVSGALDGSIKAWNLAAPDAPALLIDLPPVAGERRHLLAMACMSVVSEAAEAQAAMAGMPGAAPADQPLIICGYDDGTVTLRDPRLDLAAVANLNGNKNGGHRDGVRAVCPAPGNVFFTTGNDLKFFVWKWFEA
jgi:WD40 repeat protein